MRTRMYGGVVGEERRLSPYTDSWKCSSQLPLGADAFVRRLREVLRKPEGIWRSAMLLVVIEPLAALGDRGNVARRDPPKAVAGLVHFLEPFGAVTKNASVIGLVREIAQSFERFPNGHIDDDEGIVAVRDVRGVARFGLQTPHKTGGLVREGVDGFELSNKFGDSGIVDGRDKPSDVDLGQIAVHGDSSGTATRRIRN